MRLFPDTAGIYRGRCGKTAYIKEHIDTKIMCGIMPLVSYKNAMFVKNEMPGIHVSDEIVNRYREDMTREEAEEVAIELSVEIAAKLYDIADGFLFYDTI